MEYRYERDEKTRPICNLQLTNELHNGNTRIHHKKPDKTECLFSNASFYETAKKQRRRDKELTFKITSGTKKNTE
jgi:hypothetical protein